MEKPPDNTPARYPTESRQILLQNFEAFRDLVLQARTFVKRGQYEMAAIYADMADEYASWMGHCGIFASPELEHVLLTIGQRAIQSKPHPNQSFSPSKEPKNVLHVVYNVWTIGGHSRLLWRWIQQDSQRSHSVVLTRMAVADVPTPIKDAVLNSQGKLYALTDGSFISRAKRLREIATAADVVVLHTLYDASISSIAFANKQQSPPVIYVNHADERFWLGVGISDVVANLRESGMRLSLKRRGIELERNRLLPIIVEPFQRQLSRTEAKQQLGIDSQSVMLLSIARAVKYKMPDGTSFADAHVALLKRHKQAILVVVGPGDQEDWSAAIQQTQGRIRVLGETKETEVFYQAADIYVDSFPFMSNTSLLEAGSYGTPLVSRYPYSSDDCEIFGADMPGLTGNLMRVQTPEEYEAVLSRLIEDEEFRSSLGQKTQRQIQDKHIGNNWIRSLEEIYAFAATLPRVAMTSVPQDQIFTGEPDIFLEKVFPFTQPNLNKLVQDRVRLMPFNKRFSFWLKQLKMGNFGRTGNISLLIPQWLYSYLIKLTKSK